MKIVFFGTPDYVLPIAQKLYKEFRKKDEKSPIVAVVTQKPKPVGRKQKIKYSPIDTWAHDKNIPIFFDSNDLISEKISADVGVLAAYGEVISDKVIKHFAHGILNVHPSLLPQFRGSSPVRATILENKKNAGVTIIKLDSKLDHGPIISQAEYEILPIDTAESLRERLFQASADIISSLLPAYIAGKIKPKEQDHSHASFTTEVKKADAQIPPSYLDAALNGKVGKGKWNIRFMKDFSFSPTPENIHNFIRAMHPWPTAWTTVNLGPEDKNQKEKRVKIIKSHLKGNKLVLDEIQLEGKNPVSWKQFTEGYPNAIFL